jgi:hypothetical protein
VFLGEALAVVDWLAIGLIVTVNTVAVPVTPAAEPFPQRCPSRPDPCHLFLLKPTLGVRGLG